MNFWRSSGYDTLKRNDQGDLQISDDFLRRYFQRAEMQPVTESCDLERAIHAQLMDNPRAPISKERLEGVADADIRHNYAVVLRFRDRMLQASSLKAFYLDLFSRQVDVPPLFVQELTQVFLRDMLDGTEDPLLVRTAELFFRPQKISIQNGQIMAADLEVVEIHASTGGLGQIGKLMVEAQIPPRAIDLTVLVRENQDLYWMQDERHTMALCLNIGHPAVAALVELIKRWINYFLHVGVAIEPRQSIESSNWVWHVGLDAEASSILNTLYQGGEVDEVRMHRILGLFALRFEKSAMVLPEIADQPVYLAMAMDGQNVLRIKPQNLLLNLPLVNH